MNNRVTAGSILITLGIVFGDIGTSPLYVFTAITGGVNFDEGLILGALSCVFWTLVILASFKYIYLALNADNKGEGGIFALYALLLKTRTKWLIFPAIIGCATLISDGFLTPAISISSAIEGLSLRFPEIQTLPIVVAIVILLFLFQQYGTQVVGKTFGPVMLLWFLMLGTLGSIQIFHNPFVLRALNPVYAFQFIFYYPNGFWLMSAVFLCTTGAEALYSDLGHCGKRNIRISWAFVVTMLLLNYFGQAAFCLGLSKGEVLGSVFYSMVPNAILPFVIVLATLAAVIASQALITGIFTLVNEAIKLKLWASLRVKYPTDEKGQIYIPFINYFLMFGCLTILFIFRKSTNMEAAYGLAIVIDMIMTSTLLAYLLFISRKSIIYSVLSISLFLSLELVFLISNSNKIIHGGWFPLLSSFVLFILLFLYYRARRIRQKITDYESTAALLPILKDVSIDPAIPYYATNLIYLARSDNKNRLDKNIVYSLLKLFPKKALIYWFIHVETLDKPRGKKYTCDVLLPNKCFFIRIKFGFKEQHLIEPIFYKIRAELAEQNQVSLKSAFTSLNEHNIPADFKFLLLNTRLSNIRNLSFLDYTSIIVYRFIKTMGVSIVTDFGIDNSRTVQEIIPAALSEKNY